MEDVWNFSLERMRTAGRDDARQPSGIPLHSATGRRSVLIRRSHRLDQSSRWSLITRVRQGASSPRHMSISTGNILGGAVLLRLTAPPHGQSCSM